MDLFFGVTGSAITKSGSVKSMGWVEEISLALKRMLKEAIGSEEVVGENLNGQYCCECCRKLSGVAINNRPT